MNTTSYTPGATGGNKEWLDGPLTILEPEETPFVSTTRKNGGAKATYHEVVADTLDGVKITGTREGDSGPKGGNKASKRERFGSYLGRYFRSFGVSDVQQAISKNGGVHAVADEYAYAKAKAIRELKRDMEAACLSALDGQGGTDDEMRMRGIFYWLADSQTPAVPADFRPPNDQQITGQAALLESGSNSLTTALQSLFNTSGGRRTYDGYIGSTYMGNVDNFTRTGPELTSTYGTRVVYDGESAKTIRLNVELFDSSFGLVNFIPDQWLQISTDGGTGDPACLVLCYRDYWSIDFLENLHAVDDEEDAGGKSGYVKAIGGLMCRMPKGNAYIYNS